jgi:hypothetical protein
MKQIKLYRRLGDCVRVLMETGGIPVESIVGIAYFDCIKGGCDLKEPAFGKVEAPQNSGAQRDECPGEQCINFPGTCSVCCHGTECYAQRKKN